MSGQSVLVILLVGLVAGWLAGLIVRGFGFGLIANIGIGVIGALIALPILAVLRETAVYLSRHVEFEPWNGARRGLL